MTSVAQAIGIGVLASLAIIAIRATGALETVELAAYDWTLRLRPSVHQPDPHIVLITITEEDIQNQGRWPLSDELVAQVLEILTNQGARTIGLDLYRDIEVPPGRDSLNAFLATHREIITVMKFPDQFGRGISGPKILKGTDQIGFNDILVDPGGTVRRGSLFMEFEDRMATSFAFLLAMRFLEDQGIVPQPDPTDPELLRLGTRTIRRLNPNDGSYADADIRGYQYLLKYLGGPSPFTKFSLTALINREVPSEAVTGKIVLVGMVAESVRDDFFTPYSRGLEIDQQISGVELHAHMVRQLLQVALNDDPPFRFLPEKGEWGWILLFGIFGGLIGLRAQTAWRLTLLMIIGGGILGSLGYLAILNNWWIPMVSPILALSSAGSLVTAWGLNKERRDRELLMLLFGQHVDDEVAETIWRERHQILEEGRLRPQKLTVTVLFADLVGFTSVAERLLPQDLMNWLNTYMEAIAGVVPRYEGIIDDYYGDGMKVNFGVPLPRTTAESIRQDAINAVRCGLAMKREVVRLNETQGNTSLPSVQIRIGIATGPAVVGSVGSAQRLKYTTVGDTVNIASRLEQLGKNMRARETESDGGNFLIAEATNQNLDPTWNTQEVGKISLKGKREEVVVYQVLGESFKSHTEIAR